MIPHDGADNVDMMMPFSKYFQCMYQQLNDIPSLGFFLCTDKSVRYESGTLCLQSRPRSSKCKRSRARKAFVGSSVEAFNWVAFNVKIQHRLPGKQRSNTFFPTNCLEYEFFKGKLIQRSSKMDVDRQVFINNKMGSDGKQRTKGYGGMVFKSGGCKSGTAFTPSNFSRDLRHLEVFRESKPIHPDTSMFHAGSDPHHDMPCSVKSGPYSVYPGWFIGMPCHSKMMFYQALKMSSIVPDLEAFDRLQRPNSEVELVAKLEPKRKDERYGTESERESTEGSVEDDHGTDGVSKSQSHIHEELKTPLLQNASRSSLAGVVISSAASKPPLKTALRKSRAEKSSHLSCESLNDLTSAKEGVDSESGTLNLTRVSCGDASRSIWKGLEGSRTILKSAEISCRPRKNFPFYWKQGTVPVPQPCLAEVVPTFPVRAYVERVFKDGAIIYNFWLEDLEQILIAKAQKTESFDSPFCFYSWKTRKGKSGWNTWRKGRNDVKSLCKMSISSSVSSHQDNNGEILHFLESEFRVLSTKPTDDKRYIRFRGSWSSSDRNISMSTQSSSCPSSPRLVFEEPITISGKNSRCSEERSLLEKPLSGRFVHCGPLSFKRENRNIDFTDFWNSPVLQTEPEAQLGNEIAAIITKISLVQKETTFDDKVLRRYRSNLNERTTNPPEWSPHVLKTWSMDSQRSVASDLVNLDLVNLTSSSERGLGDSSQCSPQHVGDDHESYEWFNNERMEVTTILPAGEHGHPLYGLSGPQSLGARWRSGGKCDCGSWDLGCGLVVLGNKLDKGLEPSNEYDDDNLRMFVQGKIGLTSSIKLAPIQDGLFSVHYQAPISSLQAFATTIAILHSKSKYMNLINRPDRMGHPSKVEASHISSNHRLRKDPYDVSMGCKSFCKLPSFDSHTHPHPPLSPIERV